jgi:hypothetical protein
VPDFSRAHSVKYTSLTLATTKLKTTVSPSSERGTSAKV